jgi:tetratricopeptide (TPR) repeat protein
MGRLLRGALIFIFLAAPVYSFAITNGDILTSYSMGFFYYYEGELEMAAMEFERCLRLEDDPPAVLPYTLSEVYDLLGRDEESLRMALNALDIDRDYAPALRFVGLTYLDTNRNEDARQYLERLNDVQPGSVQNLYYLAEAYNRLGRTDQLIETYEKILTLNPDLNQVRLELAHLYTKEGDFQRAQELFELVLAREPDNNKALFYLTYIYLSLGKTEEALACFQKLNDRDLLTDAMLEDYAASLFMEGQDPSPVLDKISDRTKLTPTTRGLFSLVDGRYEEAKGYFAQALKEDDLSIAPYIGLIRIAEAEGDREQELDLRFALAGSYYANGLYEKARSQAERVKQERPAFLENRMLLGDAYGSLSLHREAIEEYIFCLENGDEGDAGSGGPDLADIHIKLGIQYDSVGEHERAIDHFEGALRDEPDNDELYYFIGLEWRILKRHDRAIEAFSRAVSLAPDNAHYHFQLGVSFERAGDMKSAIAQLDDSVALDDSNAPALNYLGYILADQGIRLPEAKKFIEQALKIDPENGAYLDSMGWVFYRMDRLNEARDYLERAVQHMDYNEEENYVIFDHLGEVYRSLERIDDAIDAWKKALQMKPVDEIKAKIREVGGEVEE